MVKTFDVLVLGAGGAGLMCAATAAGRGLKVAVIDHADKPGKKILISGGGRCNFTNLDARAECYLSANPHFAKSALGRYTAQDFVALVDSHGIAWHEKTLGQLFCDGSAKQIVDMLMDECAKGDVSCYFSLNIDTVSQSEAGFCVETSGGTFVAKSLVVATGGPSIPKMGATGFAYDLARQFGLRVVEPRPALVPLTLGAEEALFRDLSGISADVSASVGKTRFSEAALFTHKGLSGPSILQISSYWQTGQDVEIDFFPTQSEDWLVAQKQETPNASLSKTLTSSLAARLCEALLEKLSLDENVRLSALKDKRLLEIGMRLKQWRFKPNGTEGFAKAEVTIGGVSTAGLSSKTMEVKTVPGLFFIGEAVDVTGWLGGYNFQWAWASGVAAGQAV